jgi:DNA helicase-2/ATP-dependent DNA helicase PcrA
MITKVLQGLNQRQIEAVKATEGYIRVVGGPGTGKSVLLARRICYLQHMGVDPQATLTLVPTALIQNEIRNQVKSLTDFDLRSNIETYHSLGWNFLLHHFDRLGFPLPWIMTQCCLDKAKIVEY